MLSRVYETARCPSVRLSVPAYARSSKPAAAGLLLWARRAKKYRSTAAAAAGECGQ